MGCGSNDRFSEPFQCNFGLLGLSGAAEAPTGPCWCCWREQRFPRLDHQVSLSWGDETQNLEDEDVSPVGCLAGSPLLVGANDCFLGQVLAVMGPCHLWVGKRSLRPTGTKRLPGLSHLWQGPSCTYPLVILVSLSGEGNYFPWHLLLAGLPTDPHLWWGWPHLVVLEGSCWIWENEPTWAVFYCCFKKCWVWVSVFC